MSVQQDTVNIQQAAVERDVQQIPAHIDFYDWRYRHLIRIFASFSDELGMRTNKDLQRMFDNDRYKMRFQDQAGQTRRDVATQSAHGDGHGAALARSGQARD